MFQYRSLYLGVTTASSWAWGASIMVGLTILTTVGLIPWLVWAIITAASPGVFCYAYYKMPQIHRLTDKRWVRGLMSIVQVFAIWIQMQIVYEVAVLSGYFPPWASTAFALIIGAFFVGVVYRGGFIRSMNLDNALWWMLCLTMISVIFFRFGYGGDPGFEPILFGGTGSGAWSWMLLVIPTQMAATWVDLQMWQRARLMYEEYRPSAALWASLVFGAYALLELTAFYDGLSPEMYLLLLAGAVLVASDTLVAAGAAIQEISNSLRRGALIALAIAAVWPVVASLGVVGLWGTYVVASVIPAILIVAWGIRNRGERPALEANRIGTQHRNSYHPERTRSIGAGEGPEYDPDLEQVLLEREREIG